MRVEVRVNELPESVADGTLLSAGECAYGQGDVADWDLW